jgi:hypothetical protein
MSLGNEVANKTFAMEIGMASLSTEMCYEKPFWDMHVELLAQAVGENVNIKPFA